MKNYNSSKKHLCKRFAPKRIAGVQSEVLVLGAVSEECGVVLLETKLPVEKRVRVW